MDARDARPYRAGYLADLDLASRRAGFRLLRRGARLPGPGSRTGGAPKTGPVGRPVCRCPYGPPPLSRAVGIPHEVDRTAQNQEQFLQNRRIRYGLLHSVTRCSVGSQKAAAALRFRQATTASADRPNRLPWPQLQHRRANAGDSKFRGVGTFSQDEYVSPEVSWRLECSGRPARLRRTVCASGSPHPHPAGAQSPYSLTPQRPYLVSLLRDRSSAPGRTQRGSRIAAASRILATLHRGSPMNPHPPHGLL